MILEADPARLGHRVRHHGSGSARSPPADAAPRAKMIQPPTLHPTSHNRRILALNRPDNASTVIAVRYNHYPRNV